MDEAKIIVNFCNSKPIELIDFSECFRGICLEFSVFAQKNPESVESNDLRLFIKDLKKGSIIMEMVAMSPLILPYISDANTIFKFTSYLSKFANYLLGQSDKPSDLTKSDYENMNNIIKPVAKDSSSQMNINTNVKGDIHIHLHLDSVKANAMQNVIRQDIKKMMTPVDKLHKKVLMYWYQARNDYKKQVGNQAIIESISKSPIKVVFVHDSLRDEMLFLKGQNPFHFGYVVDVVAEMVQDSPTLYKIVAYHDKFILSAQTDGSSQLPLFENGD